MSYIDTHRISDRRPYPWFFFISICDIDDFNGHTGSPILPSCLRAQSKGSKGIRGEGEEKWIYKS